MGLEELQKEENSYCSFVRNEGGRSFVSFLDMVYHLTSVGDLHM